MRVFLAVICLTAVLHAADTDKRLIDAVKNGNRETVRSLLKEKVPVNAREADGTTALHWAARADDIETAQLLMRAGADVKAADRYGITPISLAAELEARHDRGAREGRWM
jgi:ankyrin repeat protein